ncbi:hypothetical protein AA313_de0206611 [Arthrobotrys entomopaga]|nr:hypothetical protein AA313_de0206611 [Arthrobotrys entomopaga]
MIRLVYMLEWSARRGRRRRRRRRGMRFSEVVMSVWSSNESADTQLDVCLARLGCIGISATFMTKDDTSNTSTLHGVMLFQSPLTKYTNHQTSFHRYSIQDTATCIANTTKCQSNRPSSPSPIYSPTVSSSVAKSGIPSSAESSPSVPFPVSTSVLSNDASFQSTLPSNSSSLSSSSSPPRNPSKIIQQGQHTVSFSPSWPLHCLM